MGNSNGDMMWTRLLTLLLVLGATGSAYALNETLYVVAPETCANNGNGSAQTCAASAGAAGAFRDTDNVLYALTDTAGSIDPGDTLFYCGPFLGATNGRITPGPLDGSDLGSGTDANRITYSFACPGNHGSMAAPTTTYAWVSYTRYYNLIDPILTGGTTNTLSITSLNGLSTNDKYVNIYGGEISYNLVAGQKCVSLRGQRIVIDGTHVHHCYDDGIWSTGKFIKIFRTNIHDISNDPALTLLGDCLQVSGDMDGTEWGWNYCDHTNVDSKYCGVLTTDTDSGLVWVHDNVCLKRSTDTVGDGFRSDTYTIFERNVVTGGTMGIHCNQTVGETCKVIGNVFIGQSLSGVRTEAGTVDVAYNTFINQVIGHRMVGTVATQQSYNNIFINATTGIKKDTNNTPLDYYNLFYNISGNNLLVNVTPTTPGTGSLLATNPLLVGTTYTTATGELNGGARLGGASPAKNAALVSGLCTDIRNRVCHHDRHNMGAYQTSSGDQAATRAARQ